MWSDKPHLYSVIIRFIRLSAICAMLKVAPFPGFTLERLTGRWRVAQLMGFYLATIALPIQLKEEGKVKGVEETFSQVKGHDPGQGSAPKDMDQTFASISNDGGVLGNRPLVERVMGIAEGYYRDGVI